MVETAFGRRFKRQEGKPGQGRLTGEYGVPVRVEFIGHCRQWELKVEPLSCEFNVVGADWSVDRFQVHVAEAATPLPDLDTKGWTALVKAIGEGVEKQTGRRVTGSFGPSFILDAREGW